MDLKENRKFNFEKYKLLVHYVSNMGNIFWAVFGIFLAANAFMLITYIDYIGGSRTSNDYLKVGAPIFAIVFNLFWLFLSGRDITLRQINIEKAKRLVEKIDHNRGSCLEIWDRNPEIENSDIEGVTGKLEMIHLFLGFIYVIIAGWAILLWIYISNLSHSHSIVNNAFRLLIIYIFIHWACDYSKRKRALEGFKGTSKCKKNESKEDDIMGNDKIKERLANLRLVIGITYSGVLAGLYALFSSGFEDYTPFIIIIPFFIAAGCFAYKLKKEFEKLD